MALITSLLTARDKKEEPRDKEWKFTLDEDFIVLARRSAGGDVTCGTRTNASFFSSSALSASP